MRFHTPTSSISPANPRYSFVSPSSHISPILNVQHCSPGFARGSTSEKPHAVRRERQPQRLARGGAHRLRAHVLLAVLRLQQVSAAGDARGGEDLRLEGVAERRAIKPSGQIRLVLRHHEVLRDAVHVELPLAVVPDGHQGVVPLVLLVAAHGVVLHLVVREDKPVHHRRPQQRHLALKAEQRLLLGGGLLAQVDVDAVEGVRRGKVGVVRGEAHEGRGVARVQPGVKVCAGGRLPRKLAAHHAARGGGGVDVLAEGRSTPFFPRGVLVGGVRLGQAGGLERERGALVVVDGGYVKLHVGAVVLANLRVLELGHVHVAQPGLENGGVRRRPLGHLRRVNQVVLLAVHGQENRRLVDLAGVRRGHQGHAVAAHHRAVARRRPGVAHHGGVELRQRAHAADRARVVDPVQVRERRRAGAGGAGGVTVEHGPVVEVRHKVHRRPRLVGVRREGRGVLRQKVVRRLGDVLHHHHKVVQALAQAGAGGVVVGAPGAGHRGGVKRLPLDEPGHLAGEGVGGGARWLGGLAVRGAGARLDVGFGI
eukprot:304234-Prorocentrum_minimum.AAC.4